jgi:hypothetical protein
VIAPLAHGIAGVRDLPVPEWLFLYGAGVVLVVSFVALGVLWRRPLLESHADGRPLPPIAQRILLSPFLRVALGAISFLLLVLVLAASFFGSGSSATNIAPTFVYVAFWIGLVPFVVVLGNIWPALNPWKAAADGIAWISERTGGESQPLARYPERLGRWPAAVLLLLFAALELAYFEPANPRALGFAVLVYSALMWVGATTFGREAWFANGDAFTAYFGFLAALAPFATRTDAKGGREVVLRWPLTGPTHLDPRPGTVAVVAVMLGSVAFDGLSRIAWWQDRRFDLTLATQGWSDLAGTLMNFGGLVLCVLAVAAAYLLAVAAARGMAEAGLGLAGAFVGSLIPIALVYAVSHYFTALIIQGQALVPLASDPFGRGWDLFGTTDRGVDLAPLSANTVWYVQVASLVAGHVAGLALAHDRAVSLFPPARALRTQYPLLALMVLYTVGGLWLLSRQ